jgi:Alginate export
MKNTKLMLLGATIQVLLGVSSFQPVVAATAEEQSIEAERQLNEAAQIEIRKKEVAKETAPNYYAKTRGYRVEPESEPPRYVRNLSKTQFEQFKDVTWLDVGLDFRTRYEYRENDYRRRTNESSVVIPNSYRADPDNLWLLRTRAYVGIKEILDPLRAVVEFEDARSYNGLYEKTDADVNEFELIQAYAELYFDDALGFNRPLSIRAGRQSLELLDRRLIGNNQFRNTTNNFDGFRVRFGKKENNWDLDTFAFHPVERLKYKFDRSDEDTWIYGGVLSIREWSKFITIQPYFLGRKVNGDPYNKVTSNRKNDMDIYAPGLRVYGLFGDSGFDFDADINKQFGRFGLTRGAGAAAKQVMLQHDAIAYSLELGYSFKHDWKPRASLYYGYGSGDKKPNTPATGIATDDVNHKFDAFYGFNQPWSRNDYFSWDNVHAPKARLEFAPYKDLKIETGYNAYWLASDTEAWNRANIRDRKGNSGSFLGHEFDIRFVHQLNPYIDWSLSYAHFEPGGFTKDMSKSVAAGGNGAYTDQAGNFFYFEISLNAFGDGKPLR